MKQKASEHLAALLAASSNPAWFSDDRKAHCAYCGVVTDKKHEPTHRQRATRDHILAKAQGGRVTVPACKACNQRKAGKPFPEFLASAETTARRARPDAKPWPEHELWAAYAAAVLRKTHALLSAAEKSGKASSCAPIPSSPAQGRKASADTSVPKKARG